jgi:hypothetical protein
MPCQGPGHRTNAMIPFAKWGEAGTTGSVRGEDARQICLQNDQQIA